MATLTCNELDVNHLDTEAPADSEPTGPAPGDADWWNSETRDDDDGWDMHPTFDDDPEWEARAADEAAYWARIHAIEAIPVEEPTDADWDRLHAERADDGWPRDDDMAEFRPL